MTHIPISNQTQKAPHYNRFTITGYSNAYITDSSWSEMTAITSKKKASQTKAILTSSRVEELGWILGIAFAGTGKWAANGRRLGRDSPGQ